MAAILKDGELTLTGDVGDFFFGDHFTHADVISALAQIDDDADLTVFINSGGGYTDEGAAIHALLDRRPGRTDVVIDGVAASAASLIAMAGDTVTMSIGSIMMIHDPAGWTHGNADQHAKTIEQLDAIAKSWSRIYARKSGKTPEECRAIMKAERWYAPDEAVAEGFADATSESEARAIAAFDYRSYAHAPQRLKALASKKNWRLDAGQAATAATSRQTKEISMTEPTQAAHSTADLDKARNEGGASAVAAYKARRTAILALPEAKGRKGLAEELVETDLSEDRVKAMLAKAPVASLAGDDADDAADLERRRLNGEGLTGGKPPATARKGDRTPLAEAVARSNKRR
ncbi:MAG: head maturation protease, ClpP-related [Aliihoeflea sp.]|uniref:head maturation protease, ClpP-related n=1 Tax=Aliihoeflea sp. TaxID=2608088 RepID=UPI00403422A4